MRFERESFGALRKPASEEDMKAFVLDMRSDPLMPHSPRKAHVLLRGGRAEIAGCQPISIQVVPAAGETMRESANGR